MSTHDPNPDVEATADASAAIGSADTNVTQRRRGPAMTPGTAEWLHLAATPTFVAMALLTGLANSGPDMLCTTAHTMSPLSGMTLMYLLMGLFHSTPWLKWVWERMKGV